MKVGGLSKIYTLNSEPQSSETILLPAMVVSPIQWSIDDQIHQATTTKLALPGGPEGRTYVPTICCLPLVESAHTSSGSGHPGSQRTLAP